MNKKIIFLIIIISICALSHVSAVEDNVTNISADIESNVIDDGNDDILKSSVVEPLKEGKYGTLEELQDKINKADEGSTVTLEKNYFIEDKEVIINKPLTIDGANFYIEPSSSRALIINSSNVILKNIEFEFGRNVIGGAIFGNNSSDCLIIDNCYFYANSAFDMNNPFIEQPRFGSAIYYAGKLILKNTTFFGNSDAGAVVCGIGDINECSFIDNGAKGREIKSFGGAITCFSKSIINNSYFRGNKADYGGAIYGYDDIILSNCTFDNNNAKFEGNAIYLSYGNIQKSIINCEFENSNISNQVVIINDNAVVNKTADNSDKVKAGSSPKKVKTILTLKKVKVKKSSKKLVLTASLKKGKNPVKGEKVKFKFNGKKYNVKTNKQGIAKLTIKKKMLKKLKVGKKIKYQVSYGKITVKKVVKVKK